MNDNEYLQEQVMGECVHNFQPQGPNEPFKCCECDTINEGQKVQRDFSTPTDYCDLIDKLKALGEMENVANYTAKAMLSLGVPRGEVRALAWEALAIGERTEIVEAIAEYWRQK